MNISLQIVYYISIPEKLSHAGNLRWSVVGCSVVKSQVSSGGQNETGIITAAQLQGFTFSLQKKIV